MDYILRSQGKQGMAQRRSLGIGGRATAIPTTLADASKYKECMVSVYAVVVSVVGPTKTASTGKSAPAQSAPYITLLGPHILTTPITAGPELLAPGCSPPRPTPPQDTPRHAHHPHPVLPCPAHPTSPHSTLPRRLLPPRHAHRSLAARGRRLPLRHVRVAGAAAPVWAPGYPRDPARPPGQGAKLQPSAALQTHSRPPHHQGAHCTSSGAPSQRRPYRRLSLIASC